MTEYLKNAFKLLYLDAGELDSEYIDYERLSLFYILANAPVLAGETKKIYDFKTSGIHTDCLSDHYWTSSQKGLISIGFALYSGQPADLAKCMFNLDATHAKIALDAMRILYLHDLQLGEPKQEYADPIIEDDGFER